MPTLGLITGSNEATVLRMTQAIYGVAPGYSYYNYFMSYAQTNGQSNFAAALVNGLPTTTDAALATSVLANLGLSSFTDLQSALTTAFTAYGTSARGQIILNLCNLLSTKSGDATYGAAADAFNTQINNGYTYSIVSTNTAPTAQTTTSAGQTFTLTTGSDIFAGTAGNDTVVGSMTVESTNGTFSAATFNTGDQLTGGSGTDVLNLTVDGAFKANTVTAINAPSMSGFETVNLRNVAGTTGGTQAISADASLMPGLTAFNSDRSTNTVTVTNLAAAASAGVIGDGTVANGAFNAGYVAAATSGTLNVSGGTTAGAVTMSGTGMTSLTVNSTGASNTIGALTLAATDTSLTVNATTKLTTGALTNTTAAALTTITVNGAGAVSFGSTALESAVTKIDASGNSGGLTVALGSAVTQVVTGSSGNDVITTGAVLTTGSVNAGSGTDTLVLGNVSHANTASLAAKYTGFETLRLAGTFDASLIAGITAIELTGTSTISNMTATQAAAVTVRADIAGSTTLGLANQTGTSDVLSMTMGTGGSGTGAAFDISGALVATGYETLNMTANGGATASAGANRTVALDTAITGATLTQINLKGTAFSLADIATTKAVTIDGSALTGDGQTTPVGLTVAGSATAGSTIIGSAVGDSFTIGAEGSTYNAGSGNDTITTTAAVLAADGVTDVTINGGAGTDSFVITGALTLTDNNFTNVTGMEKLTSAATTAVSYTGFGAAAKAAFADGMTITTGTLADNATYTVGTGLYDKAVTLTLVSNGVGNTTADNITITTGSGADTISVDASAAWTGSAGGTGGQIVVSTGAGNDTITVSTGTQLAQTTTAPVVITGGLGADTIVSTGVNVTTGAGVLTTTYVIAAGDSLVSAYDSITGFDLGTAGLLPSTLDLAGTPQITTYAATAATGFSAAELTVAVAASGLVTFAGSAAASATLAQKIAAVQSVVVTNNNDVCVFTNGANTYVFENNTTADTLVELVGVAGTNIIVANANTAGSILCL